MSIIPQNELIKFTIDHLDPKAQGVYKQDSDVYFISRTLEGESGEAKIHRSHKNLHFSAPISFSTKSPLRIKDLCTHFQQCGGCHFLHTDYSTELATKEKTLKFLTKKLGSPQILVVGAEQRLNYRNRLQLHYDLKHLKFGLWSIAQDAIIEIPDCQISHPKIEAKLKELYRDQAWVQYIKQNSKADSGHIEIYLKDGEVSMACNQAYSHLGFTQVHEEMNKKLTELIKNEFAAYKKPGMTLFDLFGGNGNLSKKLNADQSIVVDTFTTKLPKNDKNRSFLNINLYQKGSAKQLAKWSGQKNFLLMDPPRSGLKNIDEFLTILNVETFFYVACDPHTFCRDLEKIQKDYEVKKLFLVDLFPSTYHFECFAIISKRI